MQTKFKKRLEKVGKWFGRLIWLPFGSQKKKDPETIGLQRDPIWQIVGKRKNVTLLCGSKLTINNCVISEVNFQSFNYTCVALRN